METLKFYLTQLSPERAKIFSKSWWTVGCTIYNCTEGSEEGKEMWHKFSTQDIMEYTNSRCDKKWITFKKYVKLYSIRSLVPMIYEDGGTTYNPSESQVVNEDVRNFVNNILVPKLSIRRMRNMKALNNLCSAMYTMSKGKDRETMLKVSKRIKDRHLKTYFVSLWDHPRLFRFVCDINSIISWYSSDEKEKPNPRATGVKGYFNNDSLWLSSTTLYLKSYDDMGHTPRYFKTSKKERKKLKEAVERRSFLNRVMAVKDFETAELLIKR